MLQNWPQLTFLHWRYPADAVQKLVPRDLRVETCGGSAWVGLVPFIVRDLRSPRVPALPWISHFPETNLRTYVQSADGTPGVWFFSLDADRLAAVVAARLTYGLPYKWADMTVASEGSRIRYTGRRRSAEQA